MLNSVTGAAVALANFCITLLLASAAAAALGWNRFTRLIFFGKYSAAVKAQ